MFNECRPVNDILRHGIYSLAIELSTALTTTAATLQNDGHGSMGGLVSLPWTYERPYYNTRRFKLLR
jgi:hypothetical protein